MPNNLCCTLVGVVPLLAGVYSQCNGWNVPIKSNWMAERKWEWEFAGGKGMFKTIVKSQKGEYTSVVLWLLMQNITLEHKFETLPISTVIIT